MSIVRLLARSAFATLFIAGGLSTVREPGGRAKRVDDTLGLPHPRLMVRLNGGGMVVLGSALALGVKPRLAATGLAAMLVPTTYVGHQFWAEEDAQAKRLQKVHFQKNVSLIGGLVLYALGDNRMV
ncbi:MAG: DoxX family protein [Candidatus Dormibacteraeota bacterium]|nr:DoxX family protein [Candidatus Dormibacteraeota bacterium]